MIINSQVTTISGGGTDSPVVTTIKFTDLRAGLTSGQFCTGYKDKDGNDVTFPFTGTIGDINKFTPQITTDTTLLSTATYLEIGSGINLEYYTKTQGPIGFNTNLLELVFHDISSYPQQCLCGSLTQLESVVFENCGIITTLKSAFYGCRALKSISGMIQTNSTDMTSAFAGCNSLVTAPVIPDGVTNMQSTFYGCESLVNAPEIPSGVTNMSSTFYSTNLVNAPVIPSSVTNMSSTFYHTNLVNAPTIPNSVTNIDYTFNSCISLETVKFEHTTPPTYNGTLGNCPALTAILVPASALDTWKTAEGWSDFADKMVGY